MTRESSRWPGGPTAMVLLERLHAPDPPIAFGDASSDWRTRQAARICVAQGSTEPVAIRIVGRENLQIVDKVERTLQDWRFQVRPGWTLERPVCVEYHFDVHMDAQTDAQ